MQLSTVSVMIFSLVDCFGKIVYCLYDGQKKTLSTRLQQQALSLAVRLYCAAAKEDRRAVLPTRLSYGQYDLLVQQRFSAVKSTTCHSVPSINWIQINLIRRVTLWRKHSTVVRAFTLLGCPPRGTGTLNNKSACD